MTNFEQARKTMVDSQIKTMGVIDQRILDNFENTPREIFVPEALKNVSCIDSDLEYVEGRFLLEPCVHARLLEAANISDTDLVLDIGCGSGYSSAILSSLGSTIIATESNQNLLSAAQRNWKTLGLCNVIPLEAPLADGAEKHAPYDVIIINGAVEKIPDSLLHNQLNTGGRFVAVIKEKGRLMGKASLIEKNNDGSLSCIDLFEAGIKTLHDFDKKAEFVF
ncbi:MAG: protein-L-isoaspartate O-methyltransferase [Alphaproteobacteria bacterium]|nr:protein-L-isoaspartate O-methyltransferase [Alphaproteobacteria bacterium]